MGEYPPLNCMTRKRFESVDKNGHFRKKRSRIKTDLLFEAQSKIKTNIRLVFKGFPTVVKQVTANPLQAADISRQILVQSMTRSTPPPLASDPSAHVRCHAISKVRLATCHTRLGCCGPGSRGWNKKHVQVSNKSKMSPPPKKKKVYIIIDSQISFANPSKLHADV